MSFWDYYGPRMTVADRRRRAERELGKLRKKGETLSPVAIEGNTIARTFWGKAWCRNLERYSDFANRLPRGRSYVRNGSVLDLKITGGIVEALVSGTELYQVRVDVAAVAKARWTSIAADCTGQIDSLVELLRGRLAQGVMERICRPGTGLFPAPAEIEFSCSCPDIAGLCKHVAAVLYGVGSRLDSQPELLFRLRNVDEKDLVAGAARGLPVVGKRPAAGRILAADGLSELFGLDLGRIDDSAVGKPTKRKRAARRPAAKAAKSGGGRGKGARHRKPGGQ